MPKPPARRTTFSIRSRIVAGFSAALVLIAVLGTAAWRNATDTVGDIASLRTARASLDATRGLSQRVVDVETGTRGYVITGNDAFLAQVAGLESHITTERVRRTAVLEASAHATRELAVLGGLAGLVGIAAAAWSILRELAARQRAEAEAKVLGGLLPICANCKKIRDDKGYWSQIELYIRDHSQAEFSHGICPECAAKLYPEFVQPS